MEATPSLGWAAACSGCCNGKRPAWKRVNSLYVIEKYSPFFMCHQKLSYLFYAVIYNFSSPTCHYRQNALTDLLKDMIKRQKYPSFQPGAGRGCRWRTRRARALGEGGACLALGAGRRVPRRRSAARSEPRAGLPWALGVDRAWGALRFPASRRGSMPSLF